jgi:hypothetical protein
MHVFNLINAFDHRANAGVFFAGDTPFVENNVEIVERPGLINRFSHIFQQRIKPPKASTRFELSCPSLQLFGGFLCILP